MGASVAVREHPSPNWDERPAGCRPASLVLHYTGMRDAAGAVRRLCDPASRVSCHYLVDEDGSVLRLVAEEKRAWHAGRSWWRGRSGLNDDSVGIEIVNPGHEWGYRPFPPVQMLAVTALAVEIVRRWRIEPFEVVAHSDIAPDRKEDPGELFDWRSLAAAGVGLWTDAGDSVPPEDEAARAALARIGYPLEVQGSSFAQSLMAFQRRYRQSRVDGRLDEETMGRVVAVAALLQPLPATR